MAFGAVRNYGPGGMVRDIGVCVRIKSVSR